jgi:outer membrane protein assembly factor BamB
VNPEPKVQQRVIVMRLWPAVVLAALALLVRFGLPVVSPESAGIGVLAGLGGGVAIFIWWIFFSRAPWVERLGGIALIVVAMALTPRILHASIVNGMMGFLFYVYAVPVVSLALVLWAVVARRRSPGARRVSLVATVALACAAFALLRTDGITADAGSDFHWRWSPTAEERLLAGSGVVPEVPPVAIPEDTPTPWPGFRGPGRDGVVRGARIATDWSATPPVELWRQAVGPGWSSFALRGDVFYTQEQRGDDEFVSCYETATGRAVWRHADRARFWESNAGAGPRGTPTLAGDRVYTFGGTGIVNALGAADGSVVWSRDAAADAGVETPAWGFAGSPLVFDDVVVIAAGGRLVGYDAASGDPRWLGPDGGWGYASPHRAAIGGVEQVLLLDGKGIVSLVPADGALLWRYAWPGDGIVQPAFTADGDVLIGTGSGMGSGAGMGVRRLAVTPGPAGWATEERWTSAGLKPYFNDFVVHDGYAYGFDGGILACIDLADGVQRWKRGRWGHGQLILLADQGLLLVLSEKGELGLVAASPDGYAELARVPAIEGKTWNHPVLVGDVLLVRNDREMAAYRLAGVD